eukprot:467552-Rhodomonas_salina.2
MLAVTGNRTLHLTVSCPTLVTAEPRRPALKLLVLSLRVKKEKKIISCPDVKTILDSPQTRKFYASLIYLRAEGFVNVDNKDMGFVINH